MPTIEEAGLAQELQATERPAARQRSVTFRSVFLGTLLIPVNTYWVMYVEGIRHTNHATAMSLFWNTTFCLFLLVIFNLWMKKRFPRKAFTQGEFIVIFVMLTLATALAGHDTLQLGIPGLSFPFWFATPENGWGTTFNQYYPKWLTVQDKEFLRPYYVGSTTFYTWDRVLTWLPPVLIWCCFIAAMGLVMICMNVIIRKQWTENEKLSYPIVQLPLAMTQDGGSVSFFTNKAMWAGFALGAGLNILNGLHTFYPNMPFIEVRHDAPSRQLHQYFTTPPWNQIGTLPLPLYPFIIAIGYFLPLDLSFSIWFFYLFRKFLLFVTAAAGYDPNQPRSFPFLNEQSYGAWFALFGYLVYVSRRHLKLVWRKAVFNHPVLDDSREPMTYRQALLGMLAGFAFLFVFCVAAGMKWWVVILFFVIFFIISIAITRVRAELGPPAHEVVGMNAQTLLIILFGTTALGPATLTMTTMFYWFSGRGYRTNPMPAQLEAFKMGEASGVNMKGMGWVMMWAMFFGGLATFWAALVQQYAWAGGAASNMMTAHNWGQYGQLKSWLDTPLDPNVPQMTYILVGAAATLSMMWARIRFVWWPFHPAGYALSLNFGVEYFWSCLLFSTLIKWAIIRYGGYKMNRLAMPFMYGVILGEFVIGAFWSAMSVILNVSTYDFAPG